MPDTHFQHAVASKLIDFDTIEAYDATIIKNAQKVAGMPLIYGHTHTKHILTLSKN